MPDEIKWNAFNAGWTPSDDNINGRKNGCLQMDNVELDQNGALTLTGGCAQIRTYASNPHTLYSRYISGTRFDYAGNVDGKIYRNGTVIATGGNATNAAFATAFNFTLAVSGDQRLKDTGSGTPANLGVGAATFAPTVTVPLSNAPYQIIGPINATYLVTPVGTSAIIAGPYLQLTADANGQAVVQTYNQVGAPFNATVLSGVGGASNTGTATDNDVILLQGYVPYPWGCSLQFDVLLANPLNTGAQVSDFYTYKINDLAQGVQYDAYTGVFTLFMKRGDFNRIGTGNQGWESVYGFRITFQGQPGQVVNILGSYYGSAIFYIIGGSKSQNGVYQYAQVNVNNTGSYLALSPLGPITNAITVTAAQAQITAHAPADAQVNEVWIYARGTGDTNNTGIASTLNQWYRVARLTSAFTTPIYVTLSDQDVLETNLTFDLNLATVQNVTGGITDKIFDIVGPLNGRWYYFTTNFMYPSDINDPDLVNVSLAIRTCGGNSEVFLWARAVSSGVVLVGTSCDIYVLTGTFNTLADGSIDITYLPLGCKYPPITYDAAVYGSAVYYLSSDGWRSFSGSTDGTNNPLLVSPNTDRLYRGDTCYGYVPANLNFSPGATRFPVIAGRNKLWCFVTGQKRCEIWDFVRQYWRTVNNYSLATDVTAAFAAQDGVILAAYGATLYQIDNRAVLGVQTVNLLSNTFDNGTPEQRKDCYTLKIRCSGDGAHPLTVYIIDEGGTQHTIATFTPTAALAYRSFDISGLMTSGLAQTFQFKITGMLITLDDVTVIFDTRPLPVSFLRFQGMNYNQVARKRFYSVPFQMDTRGNTVVYTPYIDGIAQPTMNLISTRKQSFSYNFDLISSTDVLLGTDLEHVFAGQSNGLFEFFGFSDISKNMELLPSSQTALVIPHTDFGNACKKRIRTWPFIIDCRGGSVLFTPVVDGATLAPTTFTGDGRQTYRYYYGSDAFGVDYGGAFSSDTPFEFYQILNPEVVQVLPISKQFDQLGPYDMFKYGKIREIEIRLASYDGGFNQAIPYAVYFNDSSILTGSFTLNVSGEAPYYIQVPKGTSGEIVAIVLGPVHGFTFNRYYARIKCAKSGADTENTWVTLPEMPAGSE